MVTLKINGRNARAIADEVAGIAGGSVRFALVHYTLMFDMDDASRLLGILEDACQYWKRMRKPSMEKAADTVRSAVKEVLLNDSYLASLEK